MPGGALGALRVKWCMLRQDRGSRTPGLASGWSWPVSPDVVSIRLLATTTCWPLQPVGYYNLLATTTCWPLQTAGHYNLLATTTCWSLQPSSHYNLLATTTCLHAHSSTRTCQRLQYIPLSKVFLFYTCLRR